jgi:glucan phosphoethanolaminetransferase (alkaline phosphatase superfamily)
MLIVSMLALISFILVFIHGLVFAVLPRPRRQADNCEVAFIMAESFCYVMAFICLWMYEPWKLTANTPPSAMLVGLTIFNAGYFFRRIGALIDGRERRRNQRRAEDDSVDRRVRRPSE